MPAAPLFELATDANWQSVLLRRDARGTRRGTEVLSTSKFTFVLTVAVESTLKTGVSLVGAIASASTRFEALVPSLRRRFLALALRACRLSCISRSSFSFHVSLRSRTLNCRSRSARRRARARWVQERQQLAASRSRREVIAQPRPSVYT